MTHLPRRMMIGELHSGRRARTSVLATRIVQAAIFMLLPCVGASMGKEEARMYDRNLQHFSPEGRIYQVRVAVASSMSFSMTSSSLQIFVPETVMRPTTYHVLSLNRFETLPPALPVGTVRRARCPPRQSCCCLEQRPGCASAMRGTTPRLGIRG